MRNVEESEDRDAGLHPPSRVAEADHWVGVYSELVESSRELLTEVVRQGAELGAQPSIDATRARLVLEIQIKLHELHLGYWQRRKDQLLG